MVQQEAANDDLECPSSTVPPRTPIRTPILSMSTPSTTATTTTTSTTTNSTPLSSSSPSSNHRWMGALSLVDDPNDIEVSTTETFDDPEGNNDMMMTMMMLRENPTNTTADTLDDLVLSLSSFMSYSQSLHSYDSEYCPLEEQRQRQRQCEQREQQRHAQKKRQPTKKGTPRASPNMKDPDTSHPKHLEFLQHFVRLTIFVLILLILLVATGGLYYWIVFDNGLFSSSSSSSNGTTVPSDPMNVTMNVTITNVNETIHNDSNVLDRRDDDTARLPSTAPSSVTTATTPTPTTPTTATPTPTTATPSTSPTNLPTISSFSHTPSTEPSTEPSLPFLVCPPMTPPPPLPGKKGVVFTLREPGRPGSWVENLPKVLALNAYWNYKWGMDRIDHQPTTLEFVPMLWGGNGKAMERFNESLETMRLAGHAPIRLMGFNEPDKQAQSNLSVERALEVWPLLQATNLPLVSPSCAQADGPWMKEFMAGLYKQLQQHHEDCPRPVVDWIGVHWYGGTNVTAFQNRMRLIYELYRIPIMITEFAPADWTASTTQDNKHTPAAVLDFMKQALPWLEAQDWVAGYSWFSFPIDSAVGTSSALFFNDTTVDMDNPNQPQLTPLGRFYASVRTEQPMGDQSITIN